MQKQITVCTSQMSTDFSYENFALDYRLITIANLGKQMFQLEIITYFKTVQFVYVVY